MVQVWISLWVFSVGGGSTLLDGACAIGRTSEKSAKKYRKE
jgi:hypothetical protein